MSQLDCQNTHFQGNLSLYYINEQSSTDALYNFQHILIMIIQKVHDLKKQQFCIAEEIALRTIFEVTNCLINSKLQSNHLLSNYISIIQNSQSISVRIESIEIMPHSIHYNQSPGVLAHAQQIWDA
ncbi:unnamed protein product [Paramecium octaurelia]|uniref:Uncharacterized protein n=1 Tax=Paramecium octaurelia TaxID=43137 RepID=A0A8S1VM35_PAROT|nr:unnamed protein product [Paramecium octaurelia]